MLTKKDKVELYNCLLVTRKLTVHRYIAIYTVRWGTQCTISVWLYIAIHRIAVGKTVFDRVTFVKQQVSSANHNCVYR